MNRKHDSVISSRRDLLKVAAGTAAVGGIAGCSILESPENEIDIGTSAGGTMDVGLAVEDAVSEVGDDISYTTTESPGYIGTARRLDDDRFDGGIVDTVTLSHAIDSTGPFDDEPVDSIPWQGFLAFPYSIYLTAREDTDIETFDDLADATVYPAEPGYSTRSTTLEVWERDSTSDVYEDMDILDLDVSDAPGRMEEGEIDAAIAYGVPSAGNTDWVVDYDSRVDVRYVEHTDDLLDSIDKHPGVSRTAYDNPEDTFLWDQDLHTDEVVAWDLNITYTFHPETDDDLVYELTRIAAEENDVIRENDDAFIPEDAGDLLDGALDDYPFHPGAAQYYQDAGVWDDDRFTIGDRDQIGEYTD